MNMPMLGLAISSPICFQLVSLKYLYSIFSWCPCFPASCVMAFMIPWWVVPASGVVCDSFPSSVSGTCIPYSSYSICWLILQAQK